MLDALIELPSSGTLTGWKIGKPVSHMSSIGVDYSMTSPLRLMNEAVDKCNRNMSLNPAIVVSLGWTSLSCVWISSHRWSIEWKSGLSVSHSITFTLFCWLLQNDHVGYHIGNCSSDDPEKKNDTAIANIYYLFYLWRLVFHVNRILFIRNLFIKHLRY